MKIVTLAPAVCVNADHVESVREHEMGGRKSIIIGMVSGKEFVMPHGTKLSDVLWLLGEAT